MFSKPPSEEQQPVSSGELATLVDLGLSDDPIAGYFGGERVRVSALSGVLGPRWLREPQLVETLFPRWATLMQSTRK